MGKVKSDVSLLLTRPLSTPDLPLLFTLLLSGPRDRPSIAYKHFRARLGTVAKSQAKKHIKETARRKHSDIKQKSRIVHSYH